MKKKVFQKESSSRGRKKRVLLVALFFLIGFSALIYRCLYLHVSKDPKLERIAKNQYRAKVQESPPRGNIYDANGEELAISVPAYSVAARPGKIQDVAKAANALSDILKIPATSLKEKLTSTKKYVWIKRGVSPREKTDLTALSIKGIELVKGTKRFYPNRELASQLLGAVGRDSEGLSGLELHYDRYLQGSMEGGTAYRDARGRLFETVETMGQGAREPHHLYLTLRKNIQYAAEKELASACEGSKAKSCTAVVLDPATGAVLAMASYPSFNPNSYQSYDLNLWRNIAVTDSFEPGSTFKTILAAAALERGAVKPDDKFYCENGDLRVGKEVIHDHEKYGMLSVREIIKVSSNIGIYKVGRKLGKKNFAEAIEQLGFGKKSGIDYPGEVSGLVRSSKAWQEIDFANISFGQGIRVTPLQLASAYATIANGGLRLKPYLVSRVTDAEGRTVLETKPRPVERVLRTETSRLIIDIMKEVAREGGTAIKAALPGYSVAGKTGTAQKVIKGKYSDDKFLSSFIGIVPGNAPRFVILVMVDEPKGAIYGGLVAAPVFRKIAWAALTDLGVPPEKPTVPTTRIAAPMGGVGVENRDVTSSTPVSRPDSSRASGFAGARQIKAGLDALQEIKFSPSGGGLAGERLMPDFRGLSKRRVLSVMESKGLNCRITGAGMAETQDPLPGSLMDREGPCRIYFEP